MNTIEGKSQRIQIYETSIEIENKNPPSFRGTRISCDEITRVEQRGTSVVISRRGFHSAQTVVEFKDYFDAEKAASAIYNATPISRPIIIERNTLYIGRRYDHYGKSVHVADIQEASADRDGKLTIRCKRSFNSFSIQRKSSYDAKKEADMINQWLQKAQNSTSQSSSFSWFGSDGKKTSPINMQTRQDTWEPTQTRPQANPKKRKTSPIRNLAAIVILLALLSFFNSTNDSSKESNNNESSAHYTAPKAMIDYIGLTVGDIEDMFGTDYVVDYWEGGYIYIILKPAAAHIFSYLIRRTRPITTNDRIGIMPSPALPALFQIPLYLGAQKSA